MALPLEVIIKEQNNTINEQRTVLKTIKERFGVDPAYEENECPDCNLKGWFRPHNVSDGVTYTVQCICQERELRLCTLMGCTNLAMEDSEICEHHHKEIEEENRITKAIYPFPKLIAEKARY